MRYSICLIFLYGLLLLPGRVMADSRAYMEVVTLRSYSKHYIVTHHHDWDNDHIDSVQAMFFDGVEPFAHRNKYAYVECRDRQTGKLVFRSPSPALTKIEISPDENYIAGVSNVMLYNLYQLVVFSTKGRLIKKRHISTDEAKLSHAQFDSFKIRYPEQFDYLKNAGRVFYFKDNYFIDFSILGMPERLGKAWDFLFDFWTHNHLSTNFSESVTNWVFWYYEHNPSIRFHYKHQKLISVSLLDKIRKRFKIPIDEL